MPTFNDACTFLDHDHREVKKMFREFDGLASSATKTSMTRKQELAREICQALTIHTQIEEEIFYPAVRTATRDDALLDEAEVEHASAKDLIGQIEASDLSDDKFDAKVKVLGEYIDHHVKEERAEMFPKARAAKGLDLIALRHELQTRKEELMAEAMV